MIVRTRFAPSPTGNLHIGNIRTAFYAWLFARKQNGKFILRIENTNSERSKNRNTIAEIISIMKWLRLDWDEGPYFQTDRLDRYNSIINSMLDQNVAYKCFCSHERLESLRQIQVKNGEKPKYDRFCRSRLVQLKNASMHSYVVRFCNPEFGVVTFYDQIRGFIKFDNKELDDLIIRRTNGFPTYNFCVVVDDMDMNITHVIRGEEHINNTPRQINILKTLKASIPIYAHVPMILDKNKKKLSKRDGSLGVVQYRNEGFLPEAMLNYLIRLGWSYGNQEIFNIDQMKKYFNFDGISKSASIFNLEKLLWLNRYYINHLSKSYILEQLIWYMDRQYINYKNGPKLSDILQFFVKRSNTLKEMAYNCVYLYENFNLFNKDVAKKWLKSIVVIPFKLLRRKLSNISCWKIESIKQVIMETISELNLNISSIGMPLRVALTGTDCSPELSVVAYFIGKDRVLYRIDQALLYINNN